jgi:endoglucanase
MALELFRKGRRKTRPPFLGLLTRAEEVGFVGAIEHFELGWLRQARRPVVCVSLEASRTLPGAEVGKGPIVRLGDRRTPFDPAHSQLLTELAEQVLPKLHQRRIMDGGSCEGSAATAYGFQTIAMAVPLGNYHNQGLEGGPDCRGHLGPAPEFVHLADIEGQRLLCEALMRKGLAWEDPWIDVRAKLKENCRAFRDAL